MLNSDRNNFSDIAEEKKNYEALRQLIKEKKERLEEMRNLLQDIQRSFFISDKH